MKKNIFSIVLLLIMACTALLASTPENPVIIKKKVKTDANIIGHITCCDEHIPFATVVVKGTTIGTTTDETGHFQLINLPPGEHIVLFSMIGYKSVEQKVTTYADKTIELKIDLEEDVLNLDEIVVSADRNAQKRTEASVIVNTISPKLFNTSQSLTLGEGLNFTPGLRLENNCQNCGFSQVRMNGMAGPYSQILINSRPIFSGLAGVYGLELLPANMIEKVEVVRGGGSALYGSNAIAGTVNIILKDPISNSYEGGYNYALTGIGMDDVSEPASDYSINFNGSVVSDDKRSGLSLYGFKREREMFDANGDDFSELSNLENITFGARVFHKFTYRDKLALDFFAINEEREGGNRFDYPHHERDISESLVHKMNVSSITYERFFRDYDLLSVYGSVQSLKRDSYYGANQSLNNYGYSESLTYNIGAQYKALFGDKASLVTGVEHTGDYLTDKKLGYPDIDNAVIQNDSIVSIPHTSNTLIADQSLQTFGAFAQYDIRISRLKISAGLRYDNYRITDLADANNEATSGNVLSPRLSLLYDLIPELQIRTSYSQGYRAPQIFDEDLHIETSGSRSVIHRNASDLHQETSHSYMLSLDFNKMLGSIYTGFLVEAFHTRLNDAFSNDISDPNPDGVVTYTRINSSGAAVQGINMELKLMPMKDFSLSSGFTVQTSRYDDPQEDINIRKFVRTPNTYGFVAIDWDFIDNFCLSATGNYTGEMTVPYMETTLRTSPEFFDMGAKMSYKYKLNGASIEVAGGIKNIFNAYQSDFDKGVDRDPAYIYGPLTPRTVYFSLKFGNLL